MIDAEYDISGLSGTIDRLIDQAERGYSDPLLRAAGLSTVQAYVQETKRAFISASHMDGRWKDLAQSTKEDRARMQNNPFLGTATPSAAKRGAKKAAKKIGVKVSATEFPILYLTGALYASLDPGATGSILDVADNEILYGSDAESPKNGSDYVRANQYGQGERLPARPIFEDASDKVVDVAVQAHAAAVKTAAE